jgi:two-component system, NtrC family, nitrogen regulation sensor histidine kinase NtrY
VTRRRLSFDRTVLLLAMAGGLPAVGVALWLVWRSELPEAVRWTVALGVSGLWLGAAFGLRSRVARPLQSLANALAAQREGDFSLRARLGDPDDALGLLAHEVNAVAEVLGSLRAESLEATALLRRVMEEIDAAILTFDGSDRLVLANRAAERLLERPLDRLRGRSANELGLAHLLHAQTPRIEDLTFPGRSSRWDVRTRTFRQAGRPHRLLVLSDLSRLLREEERKAWQRLIRVLSHEINNSLTPIHSIAESLGTSVATARAAPCPDGKEGGSAGLGLELSDDVHRGLEVIAGRAKALSRFLSSYARLARLPEPALRELDVGDWVRGVTGLETRLPVEVVPGPEARIYADGDQLEQLLINLVDNAVDAARETGGGVRMGWAADRNTVEVWVEDDGPGLPPAGNLFVPFFTTKREGSGIGLVLSRQIAEAHDGALTLENRKDGPGAVARLRIPRRGKPRTGSGREATAPGRPNAVPGSRPSKGEG